ncbi:hypothetical protein [Patulibacter sp. SYSU D01012]|uniref:hypothetical protein n=1 Tax=Patulibacter sp. SYSU D01012 TaxID=2817381 RepID=UPI001B303818|nr:hypothetical protein [Patulibacter sp. SYSU D01012]
MSRRVLATVVALLGLGAAGSLGATWAADDGTPRLARDLDAPLFADVALQPGVPVERCTTVRPRGRALAGLAFDGAASGGLAPAVRLRLERGTGAAPGAGCAGFVPEETVYDGRLTGLPAAGATPSRPVAIPDGAALGYRATLQLGDAAAGQTRFALRLTGTFADRLVAEFAERVDPPAAVAPGACRQRRSTARVGRTVRRGARTLEVRTPAALPLTVVRPLPVYVRATGGRRPVVRAGGRTLPLRPFGAGRWRTHVPLSALAGAAGLEVAGAGLRVRVPVPTVACRARLRAFAQRDGAVVLRLDGRSPLRGAVLRLTGPLRRARPVLVRVAGTDVRGRPWRRTGRPGARGLPVVRVAAGRLELSDLPAGTTSAAVRLAPPAGARAAVRRAVCRGRPALGATVATADGTGNRRTALRLEGDRCRGAA